MDDQSAFLSLIARRLDDADIRYMVTGSMVLSLYAIPRMTRDIDIVIDLSADAVDRFVLLFEGDCYIDRDSVVAAVRSRGMFNIIHNEWIMKADFIVRKAMPYRVLEFDRRMNHLFEGRMISVVSPEDLVLSKLCWAEETESERQFEDIRLVLREKPGIDIAYIEHWAAELSVMSLWEKLRNNP